MRTDPWSNHDAGVCEYPDSWGICEKPHLYEEIFKNHASYLLENILGEKRAF